MGRVEDGAVQVPIAMHRAATGPPGHPGAYTVSLLRVLARKDVGEPLTGDERDAARTALLALGHDWR